MIDAGELFDYSSDSDEFQKGGSSVKKCWKWPEILGNGYMSVTGIRSGVFLEVADFSLKEDVAIRFDRPYQLLGFGFTVSGNIRYEISGGRQPDTFFGQKQGHAVVSYLPSNKPVIARFSPGKGSYVTIGINPEQVGSLMEGQYSRVVDRLLDIMNEGEQYFHRESILPPSVYLTICQIANCPYRSSLKRLYLESKTLELVCHSVAQFVPPETDGDGPPVLQPDNVERILEARNILIANLENPPLLIELARQVGTNKTTLNKGFRQVFGTSVFDYLRISRLEQARELLKSRKMNVSEAALNVGYSQQSSFTRAYKNHFGENPTDRFH